MSNKISVYQGDTYSANIKVKDSLTGNIIDDLSDYTAKFTLSLSDDDPSFIIEKDLTKNTDDTEHFFVLSLTSEETKLAARKYFYEIKVFTDTETKTIIKDLFSIKTSMQD